MIKYICPKNSKHNSFISDAEDVNYGKASIDGEGDIVDFAERDGYTKLIGAVTCTMCGTGAIEVTK